ncbi:hypothetical protein J4526_03800 [Desulfurococcaceae archaeon MEX13E-LK6-19]|nr:hypothetical protein J4526_03800 [Desulfurococcaceae archaeon MEX13E-LK6-19]
MGVLISFCGPDGVGKTTMYRMLKHVFQLYAKIYKVDYVWLRSPHTFAFILYNFYRKIGYARPILKTKVSKYLWIYIEFVSILPKLIMILIKQLCTKRIIIAERYLLDSIVTILVYFVRDISFMNSLPIRFLLLVSFKSVTKGKTVFICLDADEKTIIERRTKRLSDTDIHLLVPIIREKIRPYIVVQRIMYRKLVKYLGGFIVDNTEKTPIDTLHEVLTILNKVYKWELIL